MTKPGILYVSNGAELPLSRLKAYFSLKDLASQIDVLFAYKANYRRKKWDKVHSKLKLDNDPSGLNKRIINRVSKGDVDLVFIVKGINIKPRTLKKISSLGVKTVSWSNDDMWGWHNRSLWYSWGLKYYDLVVTQKTYNCDPNELPSLGVKNILFQNKAYDPRVHHPVINCEARKYKHDVVFVGTYEQDRFEFLKYVAQNGVEVHVYGWSKKMEFVHENLIFHDHHLYGEDFASVFSCSKISLNFLRKISRDRQTSRSVEIPACGGFMISERSDEHLKLFVEGIEAEFFDSKEELLEKINYYLKNEEQRATIALNGRNRCVNNDYTFDNRMEEIVSKLGFLS